MKRINLLLITLLIIGTMSAQVLTSSNLPIIMINTNGQEILNDPKITADMGIVYNGEKARNNVTDPFNHYSGKKGTKKLLKQ